MSEVARHKSKDDCWVAIDGKVFDVTKVTLQISQPRLGSCPQHGQTLPISGECARAVGLGPTSSPAIVPIYTTPGSETLLILALCAK